MASDFSMGLRVRVPAREDDGALVARALEGDHEAYARLVRPHERVAYRVAAAVTGWNADAEEATQNGLLKAYRSLHRFNTGAAFRPWLLRIVVNEAHNVMRAERRHERLGKPAAGRHEVTVAGGDEAVLARVEAETVMNALRQLAEPDRLAIALRYFAELPDDEAAALAGTSQEAYRVRLMRARRRLQSLLEETDG